MLETFSPLGEATSGDFRKVAALEKQFASIQKLTRFFVQKYSLAIEAASKRAIRNNTQLEINENALGAAVDELASLMMLAYLQAFDGNIPENTSVRLSKYVDSKSKAAAKGLEAKADQLKNQLVKHRESLRNMRKELRDTEAKQQRYTAPTAKKREKAKAAKLREKIESASSKVATLQTRSVRANVDLGKLSQQMKQIATAPIRESLHTVRKRVNETLNELNARGFSKERKVREIKKRLRDMGVAPKSHGFIDTIVDTHTQLTFNAGQRIAYEDDDEIELLKYMTMEDAKVRPAHRTLHGLVAPKTDKIWDSIYPPNGWNCRCWVVSVDSNSGERPTGIPSSAYDVPDVGFKSSRKVSVGK